MPVTWSVPNELTSDMPIIDVEVVTSKAEPNLGSRAQLQVLADELGILIDSEPAGTWVRLRSIHLDEYAENQTVIGSGVRPTFVNVLRAELPDPSTLRIEMAEIAKIVARTLDRPRENVHVLNAPVARGRIGFGGELLE